MNVPPDIHPLAAFGARLYEEETEGQVLERIRRNQELTDDQRLFKEIDAKWRGRILFTPTPGSYEKAKARVRKNRGTK